MASLIKTAIYTGVGIVAMTTENLQKQINDFTKRGRKTEEEGKKIVEDLQADTEAKRQSYEDKLKTYADKVLSRFDFPTRDEVASLQAKLEELEGKLQAIPAPKAKTTRKAPVKKAPAKKVAAVETAAE